MRVQDYDVIVVGAGHAGCEAGLAAARMGCRTLVLATNLETVALMACNPSVGGPAKAHLVREIDALGGEMALNTDASALQMRMLNTGKGAAVQALRAQCDKRAYQRRMRLVLERQAGLDLRQGMAAEILLEEGRVRGVATHTGVEYGARTVVLATGTYLEGRTITGNHQLASGPAGQVAAQGLSAALARAGIRWRRFKTGTPPRIDGSTVDYSRLVEQPGDVEPEPFSFLTRPRLRRQLSCWLTYTTARSHELIRQNLYRAPLYTGEIVGVGPRYCPSIEDKVVRFAEKGRHQIFLEPEGRDTREMYVAGLSTSLPEEVQWEVLRSIPGLERAEMMRPGYAIEYDCLDPLQLQASLEVRGIRGLFAAGQVNGTSGYEEAAGQGLLAGINAALQVRRRPPLVLTRDRAYLGVLVDDLVTKGTEEPYRLLTARAEYRLLLRQGNADLRLTELGRAVGLVDDARYAAFLERRESIRRERERLERTMVPVSEGVNEVLGRVGASPLSAPASAAALLRRPQVSYRDLVDLGAGVRGLGLSVEREVEAAVKYAGYIARQEGQVARALRLEGMKIPGDVDYGAIRALSSEARQKLSAARPENLGQAMRMSGVSPADLSVLVVYLEARRRGSGRDV